MCTFSRHAVSTVQQQIDPEGVEMRRRHQFSRRTYINKGPNFLSILMDMISSSDMGFQFMVQYAGKCLHTNLRLNDSEDLLP